MPIKVQCEGCGVSLTTPDEYAGRSATCPKCGHAIQIPQAEEEIYDAEDSLFDELDAEEASADEVGDNDRRPCPMCGEMILTDAIKCRYCDEIFDETLKKQQKKAVASGDDDLSVGEWVVAILCSGIGCIMGIIWMIQGKPKGKKMFLVSFCFQLFWGAIKTIAENAAQNNIGP